MSNELSAFALIDSIDDGVLVLDRQNQVMVINQAAGQMFDCAPAEVAGCPVSEILGPAVARLLPTGDDDSRGQTVIDLEDGLPPARRYYDLRLTPRFDDNGRFAGRLLVLRDVTESHVADVSLLAQKQLFENLVAVARATVEMPTLEATLQNALEVAATLTGAEYGSLFLVDRTGTVTNSIVALGKPILSGVEGLSEAEGPVLSGAEGAEPPEQQQLVRRVLDEGLAGWVARHRQLALIDDTLEDERWLSTAGPYKARSALAVPIVAGLHLLGVLTLTHSRPNRFNEADVYLMQAAADQMALAVRNAQMYEELRRLADHQITLYEVLRTIGVHLEPEAVVDTAVATVARLTGWPAVAVMLPDPTRTELVVKAAAGIAAAAEGWSLPIEQGVSGRAFRSGRTQHVPDVSVDPDYVSRQAETRSQLAIPLQRGEQILGVLSVESHQPAAFDSDALRLAVSLADAIALTLDNARFYAEMGRNAADLSALYTITSLLSRSLVLEDVLSETLQSALVALDFDAGLIGLLNAVDGRLYLAAARGLPPAFVNQLQTEGLEETIAGYVYYQQDTLQISDVEQPGDPVIRLIDEAPWALKTITTLGMRACLAIPLFHRGQLLGTLCLFSREPSKAGPAENLTLPLTIGQQIATAVTNARLFQAAADERSRLQALIESSRDGIFLIGMDHKVLVANAPALDLWRLPGRPRDLVNRPLHEALTELQRYAPAAVEATLAELNRIQKDDKTAGEGEYEVPPLTIRWLSLPVVASTTGPLGRLLVLRDVTETRLLERMREDLIHTTVHDLRNPLNSLFSALELLNRSMSETLSAQQQQILDIAITNARRMLNLVNAILDINRLESGRMPLQRGPFDLAKLITDVLRAQSPLANDKGLRLERQTPDTPLLVWGDASLIERVLQNLVGNAIKFTPAGGVVEVVVSPNTAQRPWLQVAVSDSGPGIPPEIQGRLFQKFTTGGQEERGSGLGLAFCKMVLKAHGELIWVQSARGAGTTFYFTMPVPDEG